MNNSNNFQDNETAAVLQSSSLATYHDYLSRIYKELYRLNANLFILNKLKTFRSDLFLEPLKMDFINLVKINFTYESCLIVTKLTTDGGDDTLTMPRFHRWVRENILPGHLASFDKSCKDSNIHKILDTVKQKIIPLRKNYLAHLTINKQMRVPQETDIAFQELQLLCDQLVNYFNLHSFGCEYTMLPLGYNPKVQHPFGEDKRPDIECILDLIVQDSYQYKMPEEPYFQALRQALPLDRIKVINEYRKKFGKPEI